MNNLNSLNNLKIETKNEEYGLGGKLTVDKFCECLRRVCEMGNAQKEDALRKNRKEFEDAQENNKEMMITVLETARIESEKDREMFKEEFAFAKKAGAEEVVKQRDLIDRQRELFERLFEIRQEIDKEMVERQQENNKELVERLKELFERQQESNKGMVKDQLENSRKERKTHTDLLTNYIDKSDAILKRNEAFEMATERERVRTLEVVSNLLINNIVEPHQNRKGRSEGSRKRDRSRSRDRTSTKRVRMVV